MRFGVYFADVWGGSERSKRAKSLKWHHFTTWRPKMTQVLQRGALELKVRQSWWHRFLLCTAPATRTIFGSQGALIAPKRVLSAQTRFGALRTPKNVGHVCKSAACVILERKELQRRHFSDLERF